jgi:hypothetical protein
MAGDAHPKQGRDPKGASSRGRRVSQGETRLTLWRSGPHPAQQSQTPHVRTSSAPAGSTSSRPGPARPCSPGSHATATAGAAQHCRSSGLAGGPSAPPSFLLASAWAASSAASACSGLGRPGASPLGRGPPRSGPAGRPARPRGPRRPPCAATPPHGRAAASSPRPGPAPRSPPAPPWPAPPTPERSGLRQLGHLGVPGAQRHAGSHLLGDHPGVGAHRSNVNPRPRTRLGRIHRQRPAGRQPPPGRQARRASPAGPRSRPAGRSAGGVQVDDRHGHHVGIRGQAGSLPKVTLGVLQQPAAPPITTTQRNKPSSCSSARLAPSTWNTARVASMTRCRAANRPRHPAGPGAAHPGHGRRRPGQPAGHAPQSSMPHRSPHAASRATPAKRAYDHRCQADTADPIISSGATATTHTSAVAAKPAPTTTPRCLPRARPPLARLGLAAVGSQRLQIRAYGWRATRLLDLRRPPSRTATAGAAARAWGGGGESRGYRWITVQVRVRVTPSTTWMRKTTSRPS